MNKTLRKSVVWNGPENIEVVTNKIPAVEAGALLLKVESCAICGSDLRILKHGNVRVKPGTIVGHEISGQVVKVGKGVTKFKVGDRVAVGADVPCGKCIHCKAGRGNCCDINYAIAHQFEGGFSEYIHLNPLTVKFGPVQKIPRTLEYDVAALAEPLACCINGYEVGLMNNTKGRSVVIFGAGPIGMMLAMLAPSYKAGSVVLIDPNQDRLNEAKKIIGLKHIINPTKKNPVEEVMKITKGLGADMIFTACPSVETHEMAIQMVAKHGVVNFFGGLPKTAPAIPLLSNFIHYREAYITGSHGSTPAQHKKAVQLISSGKVKVKKLITHRFALDKIKEAYSTAASGKAIKVMVKPHA